MVIRQSSYPIHESKFLPNHEELFTIKQITSSKSPQKKGRLHYRILSTIFSEVC